MGFFNNVNIDAAGYMKQQIFERFSGHMKYGWIIKDIPEKSYIIEITPMSSLSHYNKYKYEVDLVKLYEYLIISFKDMDHVKSINFLRHNDTELIVSVRYTLNDDSQYISYKAYQHIINKEYKKI